VSVARATESIQARVGRFVKAARAAAPVAGCPASVARLGGYASKPTSDNRIATREGLDSEPSAYLDRSVLGSSKSQGGSLVGARSQSLVGQEAERPLRGKVVAYGTS
jgi:hypothetical protein